MLAAAPELSLPLYPEPQTVFMGTALSAQIGDYVCHSNIRWKDSAPYRTVTVADVMTDLPEICSGQQVCLEFKVYN